MATVFEAPGGGGGSLSATSSALRRKKLRLHLRHMPRAPRRQGTAHPPTDHGTAADSADVFHSGSRICLSDFARCVPRDSRARVSGPPPPAPSPPPAAAAASAAPAAGAATGNGRRVAGFAMGCMVSREQRARSGATPALPAYDHPHTPATVCVSKCITMMDRETSREKNAVRGMGEVLDIPYYSPKHVPAVNIGAQSSRRASWVQREPGQDTCYDATLKGTGRDRSVTGSVRFDKSVSRGAAVGSRRTTCTERRVDVVVRADNRSQVSGCAANGRHVAGPDLRRTTGRTFRVDDRAADCVPLKVRYGLLERRLRSPVEFGRQVSRSRGKDYWLSAPSSPAPYDVSIELTRPQSATVRIS